MYLEVETAPGTDSGSWAETCAEAEACMLALAEEFVRRRWRGWGSEAGQVHLGISRYSLQVELGPCSSSAK